MQREHIHDEMQKVAHDAQEQIHRDEDGKIHISDFLAWEQQRQVTRNSLEALCQPHSCLPMLPFKGDIGGACPRDCVC